MDTTSTAFWAIWAFVLYLQQFTYLFSGRAKASGSIWYAGIAGLFSHSSWFFSNLYFVASILEYKDAPLWQQALICLFYVICTDAGTMSAQYAALQLENRFPGLRVGSGYKK